jgi:hypothetical protein
MTTIALAIVTAAPLAIVGGQTTGIERTVSNDDIAARWTATAPPATSSDRSFVRVGHTDNSADGRRSIAGSGHAVRMARPAEAKYLLAVELYASRYGYAEPPDEDFHLYILNDDQQLIAAVPFPYATIERGEMRWYTLRVPAIEVPDHFYIALSFNPHRTKGVYVGFDERANPANPSHSFIGRPTVGIQPVGQRIEWMIRAVLSPRPQVPDPFEAVGQQK